MNFKTKKTMNTAAKVLISISALAVGGFVIINAINHTKKAKKVETKKVEVAPTTISVYYADGVFYKDIAPSLLEKVVNYTKYHTLAIYRNRIYLVLKNQTSSAMIDLTDFVNYNRVSRKNVTWVSSSGHAPVRIANEAANGFLWVDTKNLKWIDRTIEPLTMKGEK